MFRSALRIAGWNALFIVAVLVAAELVFGGWFRGGGLGFLRLPKQVELRHDVSNLRPGGGIAIYRRDRWGLRGGHADPSEIDILAVGGSTTNQLYHDESETWTAVLQRRFAEAGRVVAVGNAGIDGHSTIGHLASLEHWFPRLSGLAPRLMLFYVGINDVLVEAHGRYDDIVATGIWGRVRRYVSNNSALNRLYRIVRGAVRARRARVVYGQAPLKLVPFAADDATAALASANRADYLPRLDAYGGRLRAIAEKTRGFGARPVFVTQRRGDAFLIRGRWHAATPRALKDYAVQNFFNQTTLEICREVGAVCIDLARDIDLAPGDFYDPVHVDPVGSRKIGEFLYSRLKDAL